MIKSECVGFLRNVLAMPRMGVNVSFLDPKSTLNPFSMFFWKHSKARKTDFFEYKISTLLKISSLDFSEILPDVCYTRMSENDCYGFLRKSLLLPLLE